MTQKILGIVSLFITVIGLLYLIGAFIAVSFNPVEWDFRGRILFGIFSPIMALIVVGCALDSEVFD